MTKTDALEQAALICGRINEATETAEDEREERRKAWHEAQEAGATYGEIAEVCGFAASLVIREIARYRKKPWAVKRYG